MVGLLDDIFHFGWIFDSVSMLKTSRLFDRFGFIYYMIIQSRALSASLLLNQLNLPMRLERPTSKQIVDIKTGNANIFFLDSAGDVYGMGDGSRGQMGSESSRNQGFIKIQCPEPIVSMSIGLQHNIFLGSKFIRIRPSLRHRGLQLLPTRTKFCV